VHQVCSVFESDPDLKHRARKLLVDRRVPRNDARRAKYVAKVEVLIGTVAARAESVLLAPVRVDTTNRVQTLRAVVRSCLSST
jgi:hypothetical protein